MYYDLLFMYGMHADKNFGVIPESTKSQAQKCDFF